MPKTSSIRSFVHFDRKPTSDRRRAIASAALAQRRAVNVSRGAFEHYGGSINHTVSVCTVFVCYMFRAAKH